MKSPKLVADWLGALAVTATRRGSSVVLRLGAVNYVSKHPTRYLTQNSVS